MASLSNTKIKDTYESLVKFSDNGNITIGAKQLTDGFGNNSPFFVSTTQIGIGVTPSVGFDLHVNSNSKIGGNLIVSGNLTVSGTLTYLDVEDLATEDPLIKLARNNDGNSLDIGYFGQYVESSVTKFKGLFNDADDNKFKLFIGTSTEPTTIVNTGGTGYTVGTLVANLEGNVTGGTISGTTGAFSGALSAGVTTITSNTGLNIYTSTNGVGANITFSDISTRAQSGSVSYFHADSASYGSANAFVISSDQPTMTILAEGKLMFKEGLYIKPATGTGAGTQIINSTGAITTTTGTFSGDLSANNLSGTNTGDQTLPTDFVSKANGGTFLGQVEVALASNQIKLSTGTAGDGFLNIGHFSNGTFIGTYGDDGGAADLLRFGVHSGDVALTINSDKSATFVGLVTGIAPTSDLNFATKKYVDDNLIPAQSLSEVLAVGNTSGANDIIMADSQKLFLGSDSDLEIYYDGTDGYIENINGALVIQNNGNDKSIIFKTDNGVGGVAEYFKIDGNINRNVITATTQIADNTAFVFGSGAGSPSIKYDSTASQLFINGTTKFLNNVISVGNIETTNGVLNIYKFSETSGTATGTTLLSLTNNVGTPTVGGDLSQQKTFIDFNLLDANDNEYPQVRIGAEVGQNADANSQILEGCGAFVVYTNNATGNGPASPTGLAERFRVDYEGKATFTNHITTPELNLPSGGQVDWASGDARIVEGLVNNYSLSFQTFNGTGIDTALRLDGNNTATFASNIKLASNTHILIGTDSGDAFNSDSAIRIQDSGNAYLQMKVGATSQSGVLIGDIDDDYVGGFVYSNASNSLIFKTANVAALTINSSQNSTFAGSVTATSFVGPLTGNVTGSASLNLLKTGGTMSGTITMNGNTISMGNGSITNANLLSFNDAGGGEGIEWLNGNLWKIFESPNDFSNAAGNLQFAKDTTRAMTLDTSGNLFVLGNVDASGGAFGSSLSITSAGDGLFIKQTTNAGFASIKFSDDTNDTQLGYIKYSHSDANSQSGGSSLHLLGQADHTIIIGDGANGTGKIVVTSKNDATRVDYGFYGDINTGMYQPANHQLGLVVNGTRVLQATSGVFDVQNVPIKTITGSAAVPALQIGDTDTGFYDSGANAVSFTSGGVQKIAFNNDSAVFIYGASFGGNVIVNNMLTINIDDISTGENRGLRIINTNQVDQQWNITAGITGVENDSFCIRDATGNINAFTMAIATGHARFSGNVALNDSKQLQLGTGNDVQIYHDNAHFFADNNKGNSYIRNTSTGSILLRNSAGGDIQFDNEFAGNILFNTSNIERMRIDSSGRVGIGTTSPTSDVSSSVAMLEISDATNNNLASLALKAGTQGSKFEITASASNFLGFWDDGTERMRLTSSGLLGIGTGSTVSADLHIKRAGDASIIIEADSDNVGENDNPTLFLRQDGAIINSRYGINGDANNQFTGAIGNAAYIHAMGAIQLAPSNGLISATFTDGAMLIDGTAGETASYKLDIRNAGGSGINMSGTSAFIRWNSGDMQIRNGGGYKMSFDTWNGTALNEKMSISGGGVVHANTRVDIGTQTWTGYGSNPIALLNVESSGNNAITIFNTSENFAYLKFIDSQSNGAQYAHVGWSSGSGNPFKIENMGNTAIYITDAGNVGIKKTTGISYAFDVTGTIRATSDVIAFSDRRVKKDIVTIDNALNKVTNLRGVTYKRSDILDNKTKLGVIAQEVLEVLPEVVEKDDRGLYSVAYGNMAGVFIEAIKELKAEVDSLKQEIKQLKK